MTSVLIELFGETSELKILDFFLEEYLFDYSKTQVAELSGISFNTLDLFWNRLIELGIIKKTRKVGNSEMYQLNRENMIVQKLMEIDKNLMIESVQEVKVPVRVKPSS